MKYREVPEVTKGAEGGTGGVGHRFPLMAGTLLLNKSLADPRRNKESRNMAAKTIELIRTALPIWRCLSIR